MPQTDLDTLQQLKQLYVQLMDQLQQPLAPETCTELLQELYFCNSGIDYFERKLGSNLINKDRYGA